MIVTCPKCRLAVEVPLSTWVRNEANASRTLDFARMLLVTVVSGILDGEAQYSRRQELAVAWSEDHERDGWTEDEWMAIGRQEFEVRRMPSGLWETRMTYRQWVRECTLTQQILEKGRNGIEEQAFEQLHGFSWQRWLDREKEPPPKATERPWSPMPDEWWPGVETAYQRYIHQA